MFPILLVSKDQNKIQTFIKNIQKKEKINDSKVFIIEPLSKHFSIDQIKEIKKTLIYKINEPRLYVLLNFDLATFEAQNAFLKTLEEHDNLITFLLVVSQYYSLLPTLISRSKVINENFEKIKNIDEISKELDNLIKNKDLKILGSKFFITKNKKHPIEIFDYLIYYFKNRILLDPESTKVLREIISQRYYVEHNNIDPQNAIDHILIYIYKAYKNPKN